MLGGKITTGSKVYKPGEPIWLILTVENKSTHAIYLFVPRAITNEDIQLRTGIARQIKTANEDTGIDLAPEEAVLPGNSIERKYLLTERFLFEHPGSYSVACSIQIEYADESIREKKMPRQVGNITV